MSRINPRRIHMHLPYTVEQVADALKVHKNTARLWIKQGMPVDDQHRPVIVAGSEVRTFLCERRASRKRPTGSERFYCFRCREAVRPAGHMADLMPRNDRLGALQGLCPNCPIPPAASTRWGWRGSIGLAQAHPQDRPRGLRGGGPALCQPAQLPQHPRATRLHSQAAA